MKQLLFTVLFSISSLFVSAQNFDTYFVDKTLRVDYIFSGNSDTEFVALSELSQLPQWAGRRNNLSSLLLKGNGQVKVSDAATGECIYMDAFSTLFQEWQTIPEAKSLTRSFENTFLIPYPKNKVVVEISLRTKEGTYRTAIKHTVDPKDILIKKKGLANIAPYSYIHKGDSVSKCVNVAIVAEGYTKEDMPLFKQHAEEACRQIFVHNPFVNMKNKFNFVAVESPSIDSDVSVPRENLWKNTAFSSHFDTFYSDRYLTTSNVKDIHNALAGIPYAHIIILAKTDVYGGGGIFNAYTLTTTGHPAFGVIVVHEFGHSFGGLADEYYNEQDTFSDMYPLAVEPWEANITTMADFTAKWKDMLKPGTPVPTNPDDEVKYPVGAYEGGGYSAKGIYRPAVDCRMKTNTCKDFCPVCQRSLERLVKFYTE